MIDVPNKKMSCKTCSYKHVKNWIFCEKLDFWQKSPVFILLYSNSKCKMPLNIETPQTLRPRLTILIEFSANFVELREKVEGQISAFSGLCKTYWCKWLYFNPQMTAKVSYLLLTQSKFQIRYHLIM